MKAVRAQGGRVQLVEVPRPSGDGVRVRIRSAGICSSDLHLIAGGWPVASTLGHEVAGELADGTPVAVEPVAPCGHCDQCQLGSYALCRLGPQMIHGVARDGGMAEEMLVPERCIVRLPTGLDTRDACLVEPLACAAHGLGRVQLRRSEPIAIIGAGPLGLCTAALARPHVREVALVARHDAQKIAGERLGARIGAEGEYPVVIECAGTTEAMEHAVRLCRPGGTILMLAAYWGGLALPAFEFGLKGLTLVASSLYDHCSVGRDVDVAAAVLAANPQIAAAIITHRLPLAEAVEAFRIAGDRRTGAIKVVLEP